VIVTQRSLDLVSGFGMKVHHPDQEFNESGIAFKTYRCIGENKPHAVGPQDLGDLMIWLEQAMRI
jgi:hypothetical protein